MDHVSRGAVTACRAALLQLSAVVTGWTHVSRERVPVTAGPGAAAAAAAAALLQLSEQCRNDSARGAPPHHTQHAAVSHVTHTHTHTTRRSAVKTHTTQQSLERQTGTLDQLSARKYTFIQITRDDGALSARAHEGCSHLSPPTAPDSAHMTPSRNSTHPGRPRATSRWTTAGRRSRIQVAHRGWDR